MATENKGILSTMMADAKKYYGVAKEHIINAEAEAEAMVVAGYDAAKAKRAEIKDEAAPTTCFVKIK